jgi:beta-lactamase regulating signal transducer with metallopeptidase domain
MNRATTDALAWALIHFIWQGAAIALAAGFVNMALRRARPAARYVLFCGALALMAAAPAVTFLAGRAQAASVSGPSAPSSVALSAAVERPAGPATAAADWLPWLVALWMSGVSALTVRSLAGWALARRMTRWKTSPAAAAVQKAAAHLRLVLDIRRPVRILSSAAAEVPAAVGWLRPVVLLPISALTALTPEQIELLIAHELAHIRRNDYLVNLLQTAVETVLFYHPAVWWVSGQIRAEREHCCDDLAVGACGDVVAYANALAAVEGLRTTMPALVVAANGGSLLARIQRLASRDRSRRTPPPAWIGGLFPLAVVLAALVTVAPPEAVAESVGFLRGLADAGYTDISVDEIIALKENGVEPRYIRDMRSAGLGTPGVQDLIRLRSHGVEPTFAASVAASGLVSDLDFASVIRLRESGVDGADLARIRKLGFGPYAAEDVVRLRENGVDAKTFEALLEAGFNAAGVEDAVQVRQNGITVERIRSMKRQGFKNLTLEQIVKLSRGGVI